MYDDADPSPFNDGDQGFYRLQHQYPRLVGCTETNFLHTVAEMKVLSGPWPFPPYVMYVWHVMIREFLQAEWSAYRPSFCAFPNLDGAELAGPAGVRHVGQPGAVIAASPSPLLSREPTMPPISSVAGFFVSSPFGLVPAPAFSFAAAAAGCLPPLAGGIASPSPPRRIRDPARMTHGSNPSHPIGPADYNPVFAYNLRIAVDDLISDTAVKDGGAAGAEVDPPACQGRLHHSLVVEPVLCRIGYDDGGPAPSVCPCPGDAFGLGTAAYGEQDDDSAARDCGTGSDSGGGFGVFDFDGNGVDWLEFLLMGEGVTGAVGGS